MFTQGFFVTDKVSAGEMQKSMEHQKDLFYDVSSRSALGSFFSPFARGTVPVPVPGMNGTLSLTVEGIWQGLKWIDGKMDKELFQSERVKKRRAPVYEETQFKYGNKIIGLVEARKKIFVPAYHYKLDNAIPKQITDNIFRAYHAGIPQFFYDVDNNFSIEDTSSSFSHSQALIEWLYRQLEIQKTQREIIKRMKQDDVPMAVPPKAYQFIQIIRHRLDDEDGVLMFDEACSLIKEYVKKSEYELKLFPEELLKRIDGMKYKQSKKMILMNVKTNDY